MGSEIATRTYKWGCIPLDGLGQVLPGSRWFKTRKAAEAHSFHYKLAYAIAKAHIS